MSREVVSAASAPAALQNASVSAVAPQTIARDETEAPAGTRSAPVPDPQSSTSSTGSERYCCSFIAAARTRVGRRLPPSASSAARRARTLFDRATGFSRRAGATSWASRCGRYGRASALSTFHFRPALTLGLEDGAVAPAAGGLLGQRRHLLSDPRRSHDRAVGRGGPASLASDDAWIPRCRPATQQGSAPVGGLLGWVPFGPGAKRCDRSGVRLRSAASSQGAAPGGPWPGRGEVHASHGFDVDPSGGPGETERPAITAEQRCAIGGGAVVRLVLAALLAPAWAAKDDVELVSRAAAPDLADPPLRSIQPVRQPRLRPCRAPGRDRDPDGLARRRIRQRRRLVVVPSQVVQP